MNRIMKNRKFIAILLCIAMMFTIMPMSYASDITSGSGLGYEQNNGSSDELFGDGSGEKEQENPPADNQQQPQEPAGEETYPHIEGCSDECTLEACICECHCTCGTTDGAHTEGCALYEEPEVESYVGETAKFKKGLVELRFYVNVDSGKYITIPMPSFLLPDTVVITEQVVGENEVIWYRVESDKWPEKLHGYYYVKADDVIICDATTEGEELSFTLEDLDLLFEVIGDAFPQGVALEVEAINAELTQFIHSNILGLDELPEGSFGTAYDISILDGNTEVQPDGTVVVRIDGLDTETYTDFKVFHLPDTSVEDVELMQESGVAAVSNEAEELEVNVGEGYIEFETDGFSTYYVVAGTSDDSSQYDTTIREIPSENSVYYVEPGTRIVFTSGTFSGNGTTGITRSNRTITIALDAVKGTNTAFTVSGKTLTFIVSDRTEIIEGAIANYPVYLGLLTSGEDGVPSEPGITDGNFKRYNSSYKANSGWVWEGYTFAGSASGIISKNITHQLITSVDGSSTVGVYDATGKTVMSYLSGIDWGKMLDAAVAANATATDGKPISNNNKENYVVIPYVAKLMVERGVGWHIDCVVVPATRITLSYDLNLKNYVIPGTTLELPNAVTDSDGEITTTVGSIKGVSVGKTLDATLNGVNYKVKFLGWSKDPNATTADPDLEPGKDNITVTEDTTLYAVWEGKRTTLKLQKTVNDPYGICKDSNKEYTFTLDFTNAATGETYPYTHYKANNTQASGHIGDGETISLKNTEFVIIDNVPAGKVTIAETPSDEYEVSWSGSDTIDANQTDVNIVEGFEKFVVCTNTYKQQTGSVAITKTVDLNGASVDPDREYTFEFVAEAGKTYSYTGDVSGTITNDRPLKLKAGQTAVISGVTAGNVTITEQNVNGFKAAWSGEVTSTSGNSVTCAVAAGEQTDLVCKNSYTTVKIAKTVVSQNINTNENQANQEYEFTVEFAGTDTTTEYPYAVYNGTRKVSEGVVKDNGKLKLKHNQHVIISNVPEGSISIEETKDLNSIPSWAGGTPVAGNANKVQGTVVAGQQTAFTCTNTLLGSLVIKKAGWNDDDVNQSFIFNVTGNGVDVDVVVHQGGQVKINGLVPGEYTVVEKDKWSWRYSPNDGEGTVPAGGTGKVTITNTRDQIYWLDGNAWCDNVFGKGSEKSPSEKVAVKKLDIALREEENNEDELTVQMA